MQLHNPLTAQEFIRHDGQCPACRSYSIAPQPVAPIIEQAGELLRPMHCWWCRSEWFETYELTGCVDAKYSDGKPLVLEDEKVEAETWWQAILGGLGLVVFVVVTFVLLAALVEMLR